MNNSVNLKLIEGGYRIKRGDKASLFRVLLLDERKEKITTIEEAKATVILKKDDEHIYKTVSKVADGTVDFTIKDLLEQGEYILEIHAGGYVFPSSNTIRISVVKSLVDMEDSVSEGEDDFISLGRINIDKKYIDEARDLLEEHIGFYKNLDTDTDWIDNTRFSTMFEEFDMGGYINYTSDDKTLPSPAFFAKLLYVLRIDSRNDDARDFYITDFSIILLAMMLELYEKTKYKKKPFHISFDERGILRDNFNEITIGVEKYERIKDYGEGKIICAYPHLFPEDSTFTWEVVTDDESIETYGYVENFYSYDLKNYLNDNLHGNNLGIIVPKDGVTRTFIIKCSTDTGVSCETIVHVKFDKEE